MVRFFFGRIAKNTINSSEDKYSRRKETICWNTLIALGTSR